MPLLNIKVVWSIVPSSVLFELKAIVTSAVGWVFSTTLNVACVPLSSVSPEIAVIVIPEVRVVTLVGFMFAVLILYNCPEAP